VAIPKKIRPQRRSWWQFTVTFWACPLAVRSGSPDRKCRLSEIGGGPAADKSFVARSRGLHLYFGGSTVGQARPHCDAASRKKMNPDRTALRQAAVFSEFWLKSVGVFGVIKDRGLLRCVMAWKLF